MKYSFIHPALAETLGGLDREEEIAKLTSDSDQAEAALDSLLGTMPPHVFSDLMELTEKHTEVLGSIKGPEQAIAQMLMLSVSRLYERLHRKLKDQMEDGNLAGWWYVAVDTEDSSYYLTDEVDESTFVLSASPTVEEARADMLERITERLEEDMNDDSEV